MVRLVFWLGHKNLDLPLWRLEPMQDEVEADGKGETEVEVGVGPRRSLTDCLPCGLGGATLALRHDCAEKGTGPKRDFTEDGDRPKRDLIPEVTVEDEVEVEEGLVEEVD